MTLTAELAFAKILVKQLARRFPKAELDDIVNGLDDVMRSPGFMKYRMDAFKKKWHEYTRDNNIASDSPEMQSAYTEAAQDYVDMGYSPIDLKDVAQSPEIFTKDDFSWVTSFGGIDIPIGGTLPEIDTPDADISDMDMSDVEVPNVDVPEVDSESIGDILEGFWDTLCDLF